MWGGSRGLEVQGHAQLYSEFDMRFFSKKKPTANNIQIVLAILKYTVKYYPDIVWDAIFYKFYF